MNDRLIFGDDTPGSWVNKKYILFRYRLIFINYFLFGDKGLLRGNVVFTIFHQIICRILNRSIPGWHDLHVKINE